MAVVIVPRERIPVESVKAVSSRRFRGIFEYKNVEYIGLFEKSSIPGGEPNLLRVLNILRGAKYYDRAGKEANSQYCIMAHHASKRWGLPETDRIIATIKNWTVNPDPHDYQKYPKALFFGGKVSLELERAIMIWYNNPKRDPTLWSTTFELSKRSHANAARELILTNLKDGEKTREVPYNEFKGMPPI